jgi:hypothetical protein
MFVVATMRMPKLTLRVDFAQTYNQFVTSSRKTNQPQSSRIFDLTFKMLPPYKRQLQNNKSDFQYGHLEASK